MPGVKFVVTVNGTDYRGDHSADTCIAWEVTPDETVGSVVERLIGGEPTGFYDPYQWSITIRRVKENPCQD